MSSLSRSNSINPPLTPPLSKGGESLRNHLLRGTSPQAFRLHHIVARTSRPHREADLARLVRSKHVRE
jgi:hypothetical protein